MYHQVGRFRSPRAHRATFCELGRFRAQMAFLRYAGYRVISLAECLAGLFEGARLARRSVVITFDDGYQNFAEHAFPVLRRYGYPATVFLVAGLLGQRAQWLLDDGRDGPPLMSAATVRELAGADISFGSHSLSHPRLSRLTPERQREEIVASKARLEDQLGFAVADFCYPYGDYDRHARDLAEAAGYRSALTCVRGAANGAANRFEIPRKAVSYGDSLAGVWWKLHFKHRVKRAAG